MEEKPVTLITNEELRAWRNQIRPKRVGFVPTMGALHEGHGSLIEAIREKCDHVIVSIFVNPLQFGPSEDFEKYPRTFKSDLGLLEKYKVKAVYVPNVATIYSSDFQTIVANNRMSQCLCGLSRPGHFDGVLTVVMKLFNLVKPDIVAFGKKDYQQWRLIARMCKDLDLDLDIMGCETKREKDGLAMSSRNRYLNDGERSRASKLSKALFEAKNKYDNGERSVERLLTAAREIAQDSNISIDYLEIRERENLEAITGDVKDPAVILIAARLGQTRLIDNIEL
jgi:pantoate--beta-alanine ligase